MPLHPSKTARQSTDFPTSAANAAAETLFLLSISQDEDDAAALRADLKRSSLQDYKIQRCVHLDDAIHLLQVCGFDLAFVRIDDFQEPQTAVDRIRQNDPEISLIGLVSSRLLSKADFTMPTGIDTRCRLEDVSPTLVSTLVLSTLDRKKAKVERLRLTQELNFAVHLGELGPWKLDTETGHITFSDSAAEQLGLADKTDCPIIDDLIDLVYIADQDAFKREINQAIEDQTDLDAKVRLAIGDQPGPTLSISAKYRPGNPRSNPSLYGFIKRENQDAQALQAQIASANAAIQKALTLRDDAIAAASQELDALIQKVGHPTAPTPATSPSLPQTKSPSRPNPKKTQTQPATLRKTLDGPKIEAPSAKPSQNQTLGIDKERAIENVLKSVKNKKSERTESSFPFDFSTESNSEYEAPNPHQDGFHAAAQKLAKITQQNHGLAITLSIEKGNTIDSESSKDLIYGILSELLTNVVKHAHASECIIALFRDEDDWVLQVEDDGIGLESNLVSISTPLNKIGLFKIRTKLAAKGGQLDLTPTFPKGLIARARLPVTLTSQDAEHA